MPVVTVEIGENGPGKLTGPGAVLDRDGNPVGSPA